MGFLDGLLKQAMGGQGEATGLGGLASMVSKNPQILSALAGLLSTRDSSVGGSGRLGGLVGAFQKKGLGDLVSGWISTGPNPPISAAQMRVVAWLLPCYFCPLRFSSCISSASPRESLLSRL